jgi:uncharacterized protein (DUF58 family)
VVLWCRVLAPASTPRPRTIEDLVGADLLPRLDRLDVLSRKIFAGKLPGERRSKKRGASVEFDDFRNYIAGDDLRHIDWNVYARLDRFFIKLFREEEDLALHLVIDASASMDAGSPSKLVFAQRVAVALAYIGLVNQDRVIVSIIGSPGRKAVQQLTPVRGRRGLKRVAEFVLGDVWAAEGTVARGAAGGGGFNSALKTLAMSRKGKGVMVLLSDFLVREDYREGMNYLAGAGGYDVHCLQVLSPGEMEPENEGGGAGGGVIGDLRLTDAETGAAAEVTVSGALLKRYKQRLASHIEGVRKACAARDMSHVALRSDTDVGGLLLGYLRKRGLLG